jgi:hypothetical protein
MAKTTNNTPNYEVNTTPVFHTESFWTSTTTALINASMVEFNKLNLAISKNGTVNINAHTQRKYIKLDDIMNAVRPALAGVGCYIEQHLAGDSVITRIVHESGEYISSKLHYQAMDGSANALQKMGGGLTYLRRYAVSSICNIVADEDTDAEGIDTMGRQSSQSSQSSQTGNLGKSPAPAPPQKTAPAQPAQPEKQWLNATDKNGNITPNGRDAKFHIDNGGDINEILNHYKVNQKEKELLQSWLMEYNNKSAYEHTMRQQQTDNNTETLF